MNTAPLATTNGLDESLFARRRFIYAALSTPVAALSYRVSEELAAHVGGRAIIESSDCSFNVEGFAAVGLCALRPRADAHAELNTHWIADAGLISTNYRQGWYQISWEEGELEVVSLTFPHGWGEQTVRWLIADSAALAERFFSAVCIWSNTVGETIMVFQDGCWQKDRALYLDIQRSTLENLVLAGNLKQDLHRDLATFFAARSVYERAGIPWKRGLLLVGPPGNGKTHAVKALINALGQPCLYVKSFSTENADDHHNIRAVFAQARETAPCILVLEDLDSLVTDHNRSFFLNELDGFAANEGVVTIASTNHPEQLDPAIVARPSRFDRKYHFGLPEVAERRAYLELWAARLDPAMRPSPATLDQAAAESTGFSYAYVKELLVAATVHWAEHQEPGTMDVIIPAELVALREQMSSVGLV